LSIFTQKNNKESTLGTPEFVIGIRQNFILQGSCKVMNLLISKQYPYVDHSLCLFILLTIHFYYRHINQTECVML